jgi:NADPH:quinone reductase-like Zn-dependent oxidoreductase
VTLPADYRIVRLHATGGPQVLQLERAAMPAPGSGEVLLRVLAIGVTQGDAMYRSGTYLEQPEFPSGLGTEACGRVVAVGPDVSCFRVGDRVSSISSFSINRYPLYGDYALLPASALFATPEAFSDEEGAAFTLSYIPMYLALFHAARLRPGEWLVLNAAAATTSLAALQLARMAGARVVGVVRSQAKAAALEGLGFDRVVVASDRTGADIVLATGGGAHVVLDPVLGPGAGALYDATRHGARIVHYGALAGPTLTPSIYPMVLRALTIKGFTIYNYTGSVINRLPRDEAALAEATAFIGRGVELRCLQPKIALRFGLDEVVAAHVASAKGRHVGKIVLLP